MNTIQEKNNKGITLIALVITIIVLLILAGISIAMLSGENGIIKQANTADQNNIEARVVEEGKLAFHSVKLDIQKKLFSESFTAQEQMETTAKLIGKELNKNEDLISPKNKYQIEYTGSDEGLIIITYGKAETKDDAESIKGGISDYARATNYTGAIIVATVRVQGNDFELIRILGSERKETAEDPPQKVIYEKGDCKITLTIKEGSPDNFARLTRYTLFVPKGDKIHCYLGKLTFNNRGLIEAKINSEYSTYAAKWYIKGDDEHAYMDEDIEVLNDMELQLYGAHGCIAKGSKISLADGTQRNIEELKPNDMILSYNYYTGSIEPQSVITIVSGLDISRVFNVSLENGNNIQIVDEEFLFNTDEKKFMSLNILTYESLIGNNIMINDNGNINCSKITDITVEEKELERYTLYTTSTINYIANGIIVHAPAYFADTLCYTIGDDYMIDYELYNEDVQKYGQYTYEEFEDVCTEEIFNQFNIKDIKIAEKKGIGTFEQVKDGMRQLQKEIDDSLEKFNEQ